MDTKDPTYQIPEELTYHKDIRKFQNDDLLHADSVLNPVMQQIVENTAYNKKQLEEYQSSSGQTYATKGELSTKVTKVSGKSLSTHDYTTAEKNKLAGLKNYDDTQLKNLVNDKASKSDLSSKADKSELVDKQDRPSGSRENTSYGEYAMCSSLKPGESNTAVGRSALRDITGDSRENTAMGRYALLHLTTGGYNTALGSDTLLHLTAGYSNTALGRGALSYLWDDSSAREIDGCVGIGHDSKVSGNKQIQLGTSEQTTYAYGSIQNRSDARDKSDIKDTPLGLEFISKLRPVEFKWNYRDDYLEKVNVVEPISPITLDDGTIVDKDIQPKTLKLPKDGSKKRKRFHQGFIAQEVKEVMDGLEVDFGGYQDHSVNGGCDVLSLGYEEFIAPMVKAIQEQQRMIESLQKQVKLLGGEK